MPRYVDPNSLQDVMDYLDGTFDTQLFRSLCVDIARFLPNRYAPDKRTMQANRDRFERKQLLQVFGEPDYDSPLMSASKRNKNGNHLPLRPRIGRIRSESSSSVRLLLNPKPFHKISSAKGLGVSVEGPLPLTHTPNASIKLPRKRVHLLRPISWPKRRRPLLTRKHIR